MKKMPVFMLCILVVLALFGCKQANNEPPVASKDEIALYISMDVKEDFGLLVVDYNIGGNSGSGGVSNANQSLLKHDETLSFTLEKANFENVSDVNELTVQFTIVTKYFEPNYENDYPREYMVTMPPINWKAEFGKTYNITISGDKANGYTAVFEA